MKIPKKYDELETALLAETETKTDQEGWSIRVSNAHMYRNSLFRLLKLHRPICCFYTKKFYDISHQLPIAKKDEQKHSIFS